MMQAESERSTPVGLEAMYASSFGLDEMSVHALAAVYESCALTIDAVGGIITRPGTPDAATHFLELEVERLDVAMTKIVAEMSRRQPATRDEAAAFSRVVLDYYVKQCGDDEPQVFALARQLADRRYVLDDMGRFVARPHS